MTDHLPDRRAAAQIRATRAFYLIVAALAAVAGQVAFTTFVLGNRNHLGWFYAAITVSFVALFFSIYAGAQGVHKIYDAGYSGRWPREEGKWRLNLQAIFVMTGVIVSALSLLPAYLAGSDKNQEPTLQQRLTNVESRLNQQASQSARASSELLLLEEEIRALRLQVSRLRMQVERRP
jgi:hypothetical protein